MSWLDDATIEGKLVHAAIGPGIQTARLTRSLDEASTVVLGVLDPARELLGSDLWKQASRLRADAHTYTLVRTERGVNKFTLTFEDSLVYLLRQYQKHRVSRGSETWIDFITRLAREAGVKVFCPEAATAIGLNIRAPNRGATPPANVPRDQPGGSGGFEAGTTPTITNHGQPDAGRRPWTPANGEQLRSMVIALNVTTDRVRRLHLSADYANAVMVCTIAAGVGESLFYKAKKGESQSGPLGVYQQFLTSGYTAPHDVAIATHEFLLGAGTWGPPITYQALGTRNMIGILRGVSNYSDENLGRLIGLAQGSDQGASYYADFIPEARQTVSFWSGAPASTTTLPSASVATLQRQWSRGTAQADESTWDAAKRIAGAQGFRVFIGPDGHLWVVTDAWLVNRAAAAVLHENEGAVETITWTIDAGRRRPANSAHKTQPMDACTVTALDTWDIEPGSVVRLEGEGPADGKWLVSRWERDAVAPRSTIELAKPAEKLPPPVGGGGGTPGAGAPPATPGQRFQVGTSLVQPIPAAPGFSLDAKGRRVQGVHQTDGLPGYLAIDFGGAGGTNIAGAPVVAVENGTIVTSQVGSVGHDPAPVPPGPISGPGVFGFNIYLRGDSGATYFYTHLSKMTPPDGTKVQAGQVISTVADWHSHGRPDHVHLGVRPGPKGHPDINDVDNAPRAAPSGGRV